MRRPTRPTRLLGIRANASREAWRQFISTSVDGLWRGVSRRKLLDQLGVDVKIDTSPLGGRDLLARASALPTIDGSRRCLTIADARDAAGSLSGSRFPMGNSDLTLHYYDPANIRPRPRYQDAYIRNRAAARARALLPPSEPIIRERLCSICQRRITWGKKRWFCEACRTYRDNEFNRRLISQRRAAGLCIRCGELAVEGATCCVRCRELTRQRYKPGRKRTAARKRLLARSYGACRSARSARLRLRQRGALRCQACLADSRGRHRRDRARWRAAGLCVGCGRTPRLGVKLCAVCLALGKKLRTKNEGQGFCRCGRFVTPGWKSCAGCRAAAREYQRRRRAENHYI